MMFVVLLGPPGAGKGTQAAQLAARLGLAHIGTGDLLRQAVLDGTPLGRLAQGYLDRGELVPDDVIGRLVEARLAAADAAGGAVFDGYPRTVAQAEQLDRALARRGARVTRAVSLDVPVEVVVERLGKRRICPDCGATYNLQANPPRTPGVCDQCGGRLMRRSDDEPGVVRRRLDVYRAETEPVEDYYRRRGLLTVVGGDDTPEAVGAAILAAIQVPVMVPETAASAVAARGWR